MKSLILLALVHAATASSPCDPNPCVGANKQCWVNSSDQPVCECDTQSVPITGSDPLECVKCFEFSCGTNANKVCSANVAHSGLNVLTCACDDGYFADIPGHGKEITWGSRNNQFAQNLGCNVIGPGVDLSGVDLSGADLSGVDLTGVTLTGVTLDSATKIGPTTGYVPSDLEDVKTFVAAAMEASDETKQAVADTWRENNVCV